MSIVENIANQIEQLENQGIEPRYIYLGDNSLCLLATSLGAGDEEGEHQKAGVNEFLGLEVIEVLQTDHINVA